MKSSHPVADYMHPFFYQYLAGVKGLSCNTIISYRDAIKLFLRFGAKRLKKPVDRLNIEDLDQKMEGVFSFAFFGPVSARANRLRTVHCIC